MLCRETNQGYGKFILDSIINNFIVQHFENDSKNDLSSGSVYSIMVMVIRWATIVIVKSFQK